MGIHSQVSPTCGPPQDLEVIGLLQEGLNWPRSGTEQVKPIMLTGSATVNVPWGTAWATEGNPNHQQGLTGSQVAVSQARGDLESCQPQLVWAGNHLSLIASDISCGSRMSIGLGHPSKALGWIR